MLVTEFNIRRVAEFDTRNNQVVWQKQFGNYPTAARRMPNGNTLVVLRNQIIEIDRAGHETVLLTRPQQDILSANRLAMGRFRSSATRAWWCGWTPAARK